MIIETVKIVELNAENWYHCCELEISAEQQGYIEPNAISIAQSKFEPTLKPYAIYAKDKVVGFLMYNSVPEELDGYWIYRIMVDKDYQGQGIGKMATKLMMSEIAKLPNAKRIVVGYYPENVNAHKLYASLGFIDHGNRFGKQMAVIKTINN